MEYRFEKLKIWQQARTFCSEIYTLTKQFPTAERFSLSDQIRRAAASIALNIAEGSNRKSDAEFIRFLRISQGSACEVVTALYIALDQEYIKQEKFDSIYKELVNLSSKITALINSIQKRNKP